MTDVTFDVIARDRASQTFGRIGHAADGVGHKLGQMAKYAAVATGALAVGAVKAGVDFAKMAADDAAAAAKLATALKNNAGATKAQIKATEDWITKQGIAYGVADDDLRPALGRLVTATHDVTKAQQLATLAMDVSAGSGKSLEAVSTALMKAQQGNVGGLGRLGVATKDAAGKTLSFDQIVKNLAHTFRGQAAKAADTTAGKWQRVKVRFHELAESIGYKLLPVFDKLSDWLLKKGVPKAEEMARKGERLAKQLGPKLTPIVKDLKDRFEEMWPAIKKTADWTTTLIGYIASHKKVFATFVAGLVALKGFSMAKSSGLFGKSGVGGIVSKTLGGGIQKVFVVNMAEGGMGGGGVLGGIGKGKGLLPFLGTAGAAIAFGAGNIGNESPGQTSLFSQLKGGPKTTFDVKSAKEFAKAVGTVSKSLTSVGTHFDAMKAHAAGASREIDLMGPHAKGATKTAIGAFGDLARGGLDGVKAHAASASRNLDLIGPHTRQATQVAISAVGNLSGAIRSIPDKKVQITANTSQAMSNIRLMKYEVDQLHNKTIIIRAVGGHVPGDPGSGGGGSGGGMSGGSGGGAGRGFRGMGRSIMNQIMQGIADRQLPLQTALDKVAALISRMKDKVAKLSDTKAGFAGTFGADNIFGTDLSAGGGIEAIIAAQDAQAKQASQLLADVQQAAKLGLSKSLIQQLQAQGTSGAAALHAIVTGSPDRIALLNSLNKQTSDSLTAAGMRAGNYVRGGSIEGDLRRARKQDHILEQLEHHLRNLAQSEKKGQTIVVEIDSEAIIRSIIRRNKRKGVKTSGV